MLLKVRELLLDPEVCYENRPITISDADKQVRRISRKGGDKVVKLHQSLLNIVSCPKIELQAERNTSWGDLAGLHTAYEEGDCIFGKSFLWDVPAFVLGLGVFEALAYISAELNRVGLPEEIPRLDMDLSASLRDRINPVAIEASLLRSGCVSCPAKERPVFVG